MTLPRKLTLPSGKVLELRLPSTTPKAEDGLFGDAVAALRAMPSVGDAVDALPLADFHVLRAVLTRAGVVDEDPIEFPCDNCGARLVVKPCKTLEIGPYVDGELDDEELDATLPFDEPHDLAFPIPLGKVRVAKTVTLAARTVSEARPFFRAPRPLDLDAPLVRAMGVTALGPEKDATRIANALMECSDEAFDALAEVYLRAHYPERLTAFAFCAACNAQNDVMAPDERELSLGAPRDEHAREGRDARDAPEKAFPTFDAFAERAEAIAKPLLTGPCAPVQLAIEDGTPAVGDGGVPLLGSYLPPASDPGSPTRPPLVSVYYRTFRAMWNDDGPYDWDAELVETIEHELEHHVYFLRGEDPMDDEERAAIRREAVRVVGRRESERRALTGFGASVSDFMKRTWPLWLLVAAALIFSLIYRD